MEDSFHEFSGWLENGDDRMAAALTVPSARPDFVLLMLHSLCEERKATHRALYETTRALAREHIASLRFDFPGGGDSPGVFSATLPSDWIQKIMAADARLRTEFPDTPVLWFGVRLSTLLLSRALERAADLPPAGVISWAPPESGRAWMESLLQRHRVNRMIAFGHAADTIERLSAKLAGGPLLDLDGFEFTPECSREINELVWPEIPAHDSVPGLFVMTSPSERTVGSIRKAFSKTDVRTVRFPPFWNTVGYIDPTPLIHATLDWISLLRDASSRKDDRPLSASSPKVLPASGIAPLLQKTRCVVPANSQETFVEIPTHDPEPLQGILHTPRTPPRGTVLFLHGWSGLRLGPHRMFVTAAREFCRLGFACLRFDLHGRGDSAESTQNTSIHGMVLDTLAALDWLQKSNLLVPGHTTLLGICSGGKVALHAAAARSGEIDHLALWSPEPMGRLRQAGMRRSQHLHMLRTYLLKLTRPASWKKLLAGKVAGGMVTKALMQNESRTEDEAVAEDRSLDLLAAWRGDVCGVFGGSDPRTPHAMKAYRDFFSKNRNPARFHVIENAGHSFYTAEWEQQVVAFSRDFLES